jgi:ring-1,2-phenylacetyl-CoA epoxidase subunit PaaC
MNETETAYDALANAGDGGGQWAFGTGFDDPLAGVETAVPEGVDPSDLGEYCLMLGDDALLLAQRLTEWVTRAPELEEELAIANIALDLLGQARLLLSRAASLGGAGSARARAGRVVPDEDALAYFRDAGEFRNVGLMAAPNGDFAQTMARLLVASSWRLELLAGVRTSRDPVLAAVAGKGVAETAYHRDHAARWVVRLAGGTVESRRRMTAGLGSVWPWLGELFAVTDVERRLTTAGVAVEPAIVMSNVRASLARVLTDAGLEVPPWPARRVARGRLGRHGAEQAELVTAMQSLARQHPEAVW